MTKSASLTNEATSAPISEERTGAAEDRIGDRRFMDQLEEIRDLKQFLFEEKVRFDPDQLASIDLGPLNSLQFRRRGRSPTSEEWVLLDKKLSSLSAYLNEELRRKLRIRQLGFFFGPLPLTLLLIAAVATICYAIYPHFLTRGSFSFDAAYYVTMVVWTTTQGGLGACAYLGIRAAMGKTQAASTPELLKESFEITDVNFLKIRIILGALFAFVLGIIISLRALNDIYNAISDPDFRPSTVDLGLMLVPFLLGFSTALVLVILDRLIESIRTFFGVPPSAG